MYVDGVLVGTAAYQSQKEIYVVGNTRTAPTFGLDETVFSSFVDEFYFYPRALSSTEVFNLYAVYASAGVCVPTTTTT